MMVYVIGETFWESVCSDIFTFGLLFAFYAVSKGDKFWSKFCVILWIVILTVHVENKFNNSLKFKDLPALYQFLRESCDVGCL